MKKKIQRNGGELLEKESIRGNKRGRERIARKKEKTACAPIIYKDGGRTDKMELCWGRREETNPRRNTK